MSDNWVGFAVLEFSGKEYPDVDFYTSATGVETSSVAF